jgi:hypothetical protein
VFQRIQATREAVDAIALTIDLHGGPLVAGSAAMDNGSHLIAIFRMKRDGTEERLAPDDVDASVKF